MNDHDEFIDGVGTSHNYALQMWIWKQYQLFCKFRAEHAGRFGSVAERERSTALGNSLKEVEELLVYFQVNVFSATLISSCTLSIYIYSGNCLHLLLKDSSCCSLGNWQIGVRLFTLFAKHQITSHGTTNTISRKSSWNSWMHVLDTKKLLSVVI